MVNYYKQILALVAFGTLNLYISSSVMSEEENVVSSGVMMGGIMPDDETIEKSVVMLTDNQLNSEMKDVVEMAGMLETLKREKSELDKLKSRFQDTVKLAEDMTKKGKESKKEYGKKNESEVVLANHEKVENNEKPVDVQNIIISPDKEMETDEVITLENEDGKVQEIVNVVKNGDEIVHPFEIAENLYKLGEYKLALEIYELIDESKIGNERKMWVLYQIANCYRKQELYGDAVKAYRELRDAYEGTYWAKQAQWYIKDIEWRAKVEEKIVKAVGK